MPITRQPLIFAICAATAWLSLRGADGLEAEAGAADPVAGAAPSLALQLRWLASDTLTVDVRVIAASNKDLEEDIRKGHFREDLFYRLNVIPFDVSPLRERREDIALLATHFLGLFSREYGKRQKALRPEAMALLLQYAWPGNVRELRNVIERMVIMVPQESIGFDDLASSLRLRGPSEAPAAAGPASSSPAR